MENLRRQRAPVRAIFTRAANELEAELVRDGKTKTSVQQMFTRLVNQNEKLVNLDDLVDEALLIDEVPDDVLAQEYEVSTDYLNRFSDLEVRIREFLDAKFAETEFESVASQRGVFGRHNQYRLPKLEFKKFSGEVKDWLGFWSQFKQIDSNETMTSEEKFQYLIQSTLENSKAREVVESFPPTAENYQKAIGYMKERFGKDEVLVEVYVRELLRLVLVNATNPKEQSSVLCMYDKLETQLRALATLGVTSDKFAAMLYPLVESCLPEEVMRTWERNRGQIAMQPDASKDRLALLMKFLKGEVDGEVRISMAMSGFGVASEEMKRSKSKPKLKTSEEIPTATDLFNGHQHVKKCVFCDKGHNSQDCFQAPKISLDEKRKLVQEKKACYACLKPGHISKKCNATNIRCQVCAKKHFVAMCPDILGTKSEKSENSKSASPDGTVMASHSCSNEVLLQTLLVRVQGAEGSKVIRALIDSGSQRSYLSAKACSVLGLNSSGTIRLSHSLFDGSRTDCKSHQVHVINVESFNGEFLCKFSVLAQPVICGSIPRMQDPSILKELRGAGVVLTDFGAGQPEINLLIGADMTVKLLTGRIVQTKCGPVAVETRLGWTLMGKITDENSSDSTELVTSMMVTDASITDLWKLDVIGITDATETQSRKELEEAAMIYFLQTTTRNPDGRFEVALPWIEGHPQLKSNEDIAMKRLETTAKKLESIGRFEDYQNVFDDWLAEGVIEEVPKHEIENDCHYLPHRAVIKENSETTKIRPVFDASAKGKGGTSLNECLEKGRNLLELIPKIIVGFRLRKIGIVSEIRKAFLQISFKPRKRDFLRFLWKEKGKNTVRIFRHCRVVFGISSSPFLLAAVLKELLVGVPDEWKDTALKLQKSMYVDNCVTSLNSSSEIQKFVHESVQLMAAGKFDLRGWIWNNAQNRLDPAIDEPERLISVLGLLWNVGKDVLTLDLRSFSVNDEQPATKRKILSYAHQLYDPIGFSCPVSLQPGLAK